MKRNIYLSIVGILLVFGYCLPGFAQSDGVLEKLDIEAEGTFDFYSRYVWRGFTLDDDPVVQPGISLSWKGLTFSWWGSWDVDQNDPLNSDEIDYCLDYTHDFENFSFSVGHTYYDFPGVSTFSKEFYVGAAFDTFLSPALTCYFDYGNHTQGGGHGQYYVLEASHSFTIKEDPEITFDLGAHVGYNRKLFINGDGGDFLISAGFTVPLTKNLILVPSVNYAVPFADLSDSNDGNQPDQFYGGFSLAYGF